MAIVFFSRLPLFRALAFCAVVAHLAAGINGVGKDGVAVGIVEALLRGQAADVVVAIAKVIRASNLRQMRGLVQISSSLVLSVAGAGQRRQVVEVQIAVHDVALAWDRVSQDVAAAVPADIRAVCSRIAAIVGALGRNAVEDVGNLRAHLLRRALEKLLHFAGWPR